MPTRDTAWPAGTPCWIDYGAADPDAAKSFYAELMGWVWTGGEPEYGGYANAEKDGRQVAGLGPLTEGDPPSWTTYFATEDAAATAARIREAGGAVVVEPMEIGPVGTMVMARDPQGNAFGLWQAGEHTGVQRFNEPGSLVWNEAAVQDPAAAQEFYTAVFGFRWDPVEGMEYSTFRTADRPLGGLGPVQPGLPTGWTVCFAVASADGTVAAVEAAGGKVLHPAEDSQFGRFAVLEDPWGAAFSIMEAATEE
ncbi:VOC family protein [Blastococcus sp. TML/M2B]|uniref:VOC family protein n=1 Tax=unclassified Blastococcus TaxID=2619396 RepID=UPI00190BCDF0|nr:MULTISPECIES: VOC family protein [unclassified Blastococcus]MBN1091336.1 VOC family protein [Blastococcus sp. TML/M2B]MBN1095108.1 VOC family protein [Blastococcus sp. TML/C7B]